MRHTLKVIIACFCFIISCNIGEKPNTGDDNYFFEIELHKSYNEKTSNINLSELGKQIKYIALETNENGILSYIHDVKFTSDYIFISDRFALYQFDFMGKFVRQVGAKGNAPGEYSGSICFAIEPTQSEVYVSSKHKMNVYDMHTGDFKNSYYVDYDIFSFYPLTKKSKVFLTYEFPVQVSGVNEAYLVDSYGNIKDSIPNYDRKRINSNAYGYPLSYSTYSGINYMYNFRDTLYFLNNEFIRRPYIVFKTGNGISRDNIQLTSDRNQLQYPDYFSFSSILENRNHIFIKGRKGLLIGLGQNFIHLVYDKNSNKLTPVSEITNDLDYGINFWPQVIIDKTMVASYHANEILEHYEKTKGSTTHSSEFIQLISSLKEDDNPVLVLVK